MSIRPRNTNLLGLLLERVIGHRYADLLTERLWSKIGAEGDAMLGLSRDVVVAFFATTNEVAHVSYVRAIAKSEQLK